MRVTPAYRDLVVTRLDWAGWEALLRARGVVVERPHRTPHPDYPDIVYPIDYGYVPGTHGGDGSEVDVFAGTGATGLVGCILTTDHRRADREAKLLWRCTPEEVYLAHGFINYDRSLLEGVLVLRRPMRALWTAQGV